MLRQVLGKGKNKRQSLGFNINKILGKPLKGKSPKTDFGMKSILGKPTYKKKSGASPFMQNKWKSFSPNFKKVLRKRLPDTDGDRVPDIYDCQPCNRFRQDEDEEELKKLFPNFYETLPQNEKDILLKGHKESKKNKKFIKNSKIYNEDEEDEEDEEVKKLMNNLSEKEKKYYLDPWFFEANTKHKIEYLKEIINYYRLRDNYNPVEIMVRDDDNSGIVKYIPMVIKILKNNKDIEKKLTGAEIILKKLDKYDKNIYLMEEVNIIEISPHYFDNYETGVEILRYVADKWNTGVAIIGEDEFGLRTNIAYIQKKKDE